MFKYSLKIKYLSFDSFQNQVIGLKSNFPKIWKLNSFHKQLIHLMLLFR